MNQAVAKPALRLHALPGLGDNIHSRGVMPPLLGKYEVWLETEHAPVYHDMPAVHFGHAGAPADAFAMTCGYHPNEVPGAGSVLGAMAKACGVPAVDFALPVPATWETKAQALIDDWHPAKPLLLYRPLIDTADSSRDNAGAKRARNPDAESYVALFERIRARYFVVAIANYQLGKEWPIGPAFAADVFCTHGELDFATLAALFARAALVFSPPGFATVLAQAVRTPCITVFGGFEDARSFAAGVDYGALWLPLEPIAPCPCWSPGCRGDKTIDMNAAMQGIEQFVAGLE